MIHVWLVLMLLEINSCRESNLPTARAIVIDSNHKHWGNGFYRNVIYYRYYNGRDTVIGRTMASKKVRISSVRYSVGDSILIAFDNEDSTKNIILKEIIY
jgi:hypothetical protein